MRKDFAHFEDLWRHVIADKHISGAMASVANRFPVRFVLFDNFQDSYEFIEKLQDESEHDCKFKNIGDWLDPDYPDTILTYSELAQCIKQYAYEHNGDIIITPFSELARFYNNSDSEHKEFDSLVRTIKGIENNYAAVSSNRRIYIPIVGLEGKMSLFDTDSQISIWYFKNQDKNKTYNLILTNGTTFGINDLSAFNTAHTVTEWMNIWRTRPEVKPDIICTSPSIYANAMYAQPDNAFVFSLCQDAYTFLTEGLHLDFGAIKYKKEEDTYWNKLATVITDVKDFNLENFFNAYFHINTIENIHNFLKIWFEHPEDFDRWLLTKYWFEKFGADNYISQVISQIASFNDIELFAKIALHIFNTETVSPNDIDTRLVCMTSASNHGVVLPRETEGALMNYLISLARTTNYTTAIKYLTPLSIAEKKLGIEWFKFVSMNDILTFFPDLHDYMKPNYGAEDWVNTYLNEYKNAKIGNEYTEAIGTLIADRNKNTLNFNSWYQDLKTTKTILDGREDIDVFYWIDGLGADWIPFITSYFQSKANVGIFLNELYVARSLYPTVTELNKRQLEDLSHNNLEKCGDLDTHAHKSTSYPEYIIEEFDIVKNALDSIVSHYMGKKVAIVSDHGLTALSQLKEGLNMGGVESDHHGRLAIRKVGSNTDNENYIVCDDNKTLCSLNHRSLCGKVPNGQSAHGGCTPEEVLVPIFIISSHKDASNWTATLLTPNITEAEPFIRYKIKGISVLDNIYVIYNDTKYLLTLSGDDEYTTSKLAVVPSENKITLVINEKKQFYSVDIKFGAEEDDDIFTF